MGEPYLWLELTTFRIISQTEFIKPKYSLTLRGPYLGSVREWLSTDGEQVSARAARQAAFRCYHSSTLAGAS